MAFCAVLERDCAPRYFHQEINAIEYIMSGYTGTDSTDKYNKIIELMKFHELNNVGYYERISFEDAN